MSCMTKDLDPPQVCEEPLVLYQEPSISSMADRGNLVQHIDSQANDV
jgi:hypothetical protein